MGGGPGHLPVHLWLGLGKHQGSQRDSAGPDLGSLLPPCSLGWGHGTQGQRPLTGHSWLRDKTGLASPGARWRVPHPPYRAPLQRALPAPPSAPTQLPGHPHRRPQVGEGTALPQDLQPQREAFWRLQLEARCQALPWAGCCPQSLTHRGSLVGPKLCTQRAGEPREGSWLSDALGPGP